MPLHPGPIHPNMPGPVDLTNHIFPRNPGTIHSESSGLLPSSGDCIYATSLGGASPTIQVNLINSVEHGIQHHIQRNQCRFLLTHSTASLPCQLRKIGHYGSKLSRICHLSACVYSQSHRIVWLCRIVFSGYCVRSSFYCMERTFPLCS